MWFLSLLLAFFIGLTAVFAVFLGWRERGRGSSPGWFVSSRGLGTLCILAAGAGLVAGAQFKIARWSFILSEYRGLSMRVQAYLLSCLALLVVGVVLLAKGGRGLGPAGEGRAALGKGPFAWAVALALIVTLADLEAFRMTDPRLNQGVPWVKLDTHGARPDASLSKNFDFLKGYDPYSANTPVWQTALAGYKGKPNVRYLEVGIFEGRSAVWMLENILTDPSARLTGIDPFSDPHYTQDRSKSYKDVFYSNLKLTGSEDKADIIVGYSQTELRKLPLESFDIIYIDGSHNSGDVLEDAVLSWRLLKVGGILIFDDYLFFPGIKQAIDTFYTQYADHFQPVDVGWQVVLKKIPGETGPGPWR
jgi:predicted O-methyltransferase YrrM